MKANYRRHEEMRTAARQALREAIIADIEARIAASGPQMDNHDAIAWLVIDNERAAMADFFEHIFGDAIEAIPTIGNTEPAPLTPRQRAEADAMLAEIDDIFRR